MKHTLCLAINRRRVAGILIAIGSSQLLCAQTAMNVIDYRPLISVLDTLETKSGTPINYEDVPYENAADLEDVATPQQRAEYPGYHLFVPRKGQISTSLDFQSGNAYNLNLALESYRSNKNPGDFAVEQANGVFYVIATKTLGATGATRSVASPMKASVSVPYGRRTMIDTIVLILASVSAATGQRIQLLSFPFQPTDWVSFGASEAPARDVLAMLFAKFSTTPFSYRLLFDPYPSPGYLMNIQPVVSGAAPSIGPAAPQKPEQDPSSGPGFSKKP